MWLAQLLQQAFRQLLHAAAQLRENVMRLLRVIPGLLVSTHFHIECRHICPGDCQFMAVSKSFKERDGLQVQCLGSSELAFACKQQGQMVFDRRQPRQVVFLFVDSQCPLIIGTRQIGAFFFVV